MNSTLYNPVNFDSDSCCTSTDAMSIAEDKYATIPVLAFKPLFQQANEGELHTSFEEAISDRVLIVKRQLKGLATRSELQLDFSGNKAQDNFPASPRFSWLPLLFFSLAVMFILLGFDIMGLLILHAH